MRLLMWASVTALGIFTVIASDPLYVPVTAPVKVMALGLGRVSTTALISFTSPFDVISIITVATDAYVPSFSHIIVPKYRALADTAIRGRPVPSYQTYTGIPAEIA